VAAAWVESDAHCKIGGMTAALRRLPRVLTIPPSAAFLPTFAHALIHGELVPGFRPASDPLALASVTLYLPTRRACRLARDVFLDAMQADAALLPRIVPIGDIDEDELVFAELANGGALDVPPALGGLTRRLLLTQLVLAWAKQLAPAAGDHPLVIGTPAAAMALADDLAHLMDDLATREVSWDRLDGLVPEHVDQYWQLTLAFLKIARETWPTLLAAHQAIEPAERRDRLINAEAARLAAASRGPVIAAGSTGSTPATAKLLTAIARLPQGAVVLPGLDTDLDEESWMSIAARPEDGIAGAVGHPQFAMQALLARMGIDRADVIRLADPATHGREILVSEALRPAATTDRWRASLAETEQRIATGLAGITVIEAANVEEEALAIAIALREAVEVETGVAALVTPDRALARRVLAALGRWSVAVDDSGGDALGDTAAGIFARIAAKAALGGVAPVDLLALLKHDLFRLDRPPHAHARAVAALERALLRGPRPRAGMAGLSHALAVFRDELAKCRRGERSDIHRSDPRAALTDGEVAEAGALVARLTAALAPLEQIAAKRSCTVRALAALHRGAVAALSLDERGACAAFAGPDGLALAETFEELVSEPAADFDISPSDYGELFDAVISSRAVRRPGAPGARVRIYGPLEARLTQIDRVVLGGLVEGIWPPEARSDPWLNRPMRQRLGLDLPERRIGLSAHDFAQMLGAREAILTRSAKVAGAPAVASRFLQRLAAVAGEPRWAAAVGRGERYLELARALDRAETTARIKQPQPRPPRAARPSALSVTEIEHWLRDPYTIYAKHILRLARLDPVDTPLGAADRGSAIHDAIGAFAQAFAEELPIDAERELLRIGKARFEPLEDFPEARAFWWPRFERIAAWLVQWDRQRRRDLAGLQAEIRGEISLDLGGGRQFRLYGRADRIERLKDGSYAVLDFKTGSPPSDKLVRIGIAPQLTLEAAMLRHGGFKDFGPGASIAELVYVALKGGDPPGEPRAVDLEDRSADAAADDALEKLKVLAARFEDESTPYRSLVLPMWKNRYGTYDDLARVKEWSAAGGLEEAEE
jgi:ATP-dependent helicase/nuclease subunit B